MNILGIDFAFPSTSIYMENQNNSEEPPTEKPDLSEEVNAYLLDYKTKLDEAKEET